MMRRTLCICGGLLLLIPAVAYAQNEDSPVEESQRLLESNTDGEWYYGNTVIRIDFDGLDSVRESELRAITDSYIGRPFSDQLLQDVQRRLYALDFFSDVSPRAERVILGANAANEMILVFSVSENPLVASVDFVGNDRISNRELRDTAATKNDDVVIDADLRLDVAALTQLYQNRGFPNAQVSYRLEPREKDPSEVEVYFDIVEGQQEVVRNIVFRGNTIIADNVLAGVMETKTQGLFRRGELSAATLRQDERAIEEYYRSRGYIDAQVLDIARSREEDDDERRIFYTIEVAVEEGGRHTLGSVDFRGNSIYSEQELRAVLRMRPGDLLDLNRFDNDFQRVVNLYFDNGYIFNNIQRIESRDEETNEVSFVISIQERPRAHIEDIIIRGNTKTKDHVILRELPFAGGEVFSASRVRQGVLNLYNLQYFGNVLPETPPGSADGLMELILNVEEGQTADIRLGLAFGGTSEFPVAIQAGWNERNFLGNGQTLGVDLTLSFATQRIGLSFTEPWLGNERLSLRTDLTFSRSTISGVPQDILVPIFGDEDSSAVPDPYTGAYVFSRAVEDYNGVPYAAGDFFPGAPTGAEIDSLGLQTDYEFAGGENRAPISEEYLLNYTLWAARLGVGIGYRIPTPLGLIRLGTGVSTQLESIEYNSSAFRPQDPLIRDGLNTIGFINRLFVRGALDARDIFFNPTSGHYLGQVLTFTGGPLFGERHYIRSDTRGELYFTLVNAPIGDTYDFKLVLGVTSLFSAIFPHFFVPPEFRNREQPIATRQELLYIDGVFYGRGWPRVLEGEALWDSVVELKFPIVERILWFEFFFENAILWSDLEAITQVNFVENMLFTFGGGIRFTIPQFPIRLYFAKRFRIVDGQVEWQTSPLFNGDNTPGGGIDFVFSIGTDLF